MSLAKWIGATGGGVPGVKELAGTVAVSSTVTGLLSVITKYENFLADYTEVDPGNDIVLTSNKVEWTEIPHTLTNARVYCDKGANYFSGAYKHQFEIQYTSASPDVITLFWGVLDEGTYADALYYDVTGGLKLQRENGGMETDNWTGFQKNTTYYVTIRRTAGGTLTAEIRTGSHTGNLEDTLQVTGATGDCNLIFGYMNLGDTDAYATGFTQNLNLDVEEVVLLAGTVAIESTAAGVLKTTRKLAGVVAIESTIAGELVSPTRALAGTVAIASITSGALKAIRKLAGVIVIESSVVGELVSPIREFAGVVAIESTIAGILKATRKITGVVVIESSVVGELRRIKTLVGVVAINSATAGAIKLIQKLIGTVAISSIVEGELTSPTRELAGTTVIASTVTGELRVISVQELAGQVVIESTASGILSKNIYLVGTVAIESTVVGQIKSISNLAGVVTISSTTTGNIKAIRSFVGVVAISSVVTGELIRIGIQELSGVIVIESTVFGNISLPEEKMLAGIVVIRSAVTGELVVRYPEITPAMHEDLIDPYGDMGAWLWLAEIIVPTQATQRIACNTTDVVYGGITFSKSNFVPGRIPLAGDGSIPRIQLRVAQDEAGALEGIVNATKGGENGTVKLIRTCEKYFDSPINALERTYDILTAGSDPMWVTFTLGIPNPLTQRIPLWSYSSKVCPLATPSLFKGPRCQLPLEHEDTVCTGLFEDCRTKGNAIHWGAEIGLDPNAVRV